MCLITTKKTNMKNITIYLGIVLMLSLLSAGALAKVVDKTFSSPNGVLEYCRSLPTIPGGTYHADDKHTEKKFCKYDLYDGNTAMCPKTWSTSPGTVFYSTAKSEYAGRAIEFESQWCSKTKGTAKTPAHKVAKFKSTMNSTESSATFSNSSLLYYHFSRYFDTFIYVPPAVERSIDVKEHLKRVTHKGSKWSTKTKMLHAGWLKLEMAEENPGTYHPQKELFTDDNSAIYGILIDTSGHRYKPEFNGTRESGWGKGQNNDFQNTPPYLALRSELPLKKAITSGLEQARKNPQLRKAIASGFSDLQMLLWMQELTEITLLDYIFNQQDRIGNIDYQWYWFWQDGDSLKSRPTDGMSVPADIAQFEPQRIKRSYLNDNDAGGKANYVNFTKLTKMLEKQRHYKASSYQKLQQLASDFSSTGELFQYLDGNFSLSQRQKDLIVKNTVAAAAILKDSCNSGKLIFDLEPEEFALTGRVSPKSLSCD